MEKICRFWDIARFYHYMGPCKFLRWNSDHFQIKIFCFLWDNLTILRLFNWGENIGKNDNFWDIALIYDSKGLSQFFEVKIRLHPNWIFVVSMGWMDHYKTTLLKGLLCKKVYFLRYRTLLSFYWTLSVFRGENQTTSKSNF